MGSGGSAKRDTQERGTREQVLRDAESSAGRALSPHIDAAKPALGDAVPCPRGKGRGLKLLWGRDSPHSAPPAPDLRPRAPHGAGAGPALQGELREDAGVSGTFWEGWLWERNQGTRQGKETAKASPPRQQLLPNMSQLVKEAEIEAVPSRGRGRRDELGLLTPQGGGQAGGRAPR